MAVSAIVPRVIEAAAQEDGTEVQDPCGPWLGLEHTGLFETFADHGFAAGFDHAAPDEPALAPIGAVEHAMLVALEEPELLCHRFRIVGALQLPRTCLLDHGADPITEQESFPSSET